MKMRKFLLLVVGLCALNFGFSQNTVRFSHYNFAKSIYNPGALATDAHYTADLIYRNQWAGVDGAPTTVGFNTAYELNDEMAVGVNFYNDRIGLNQTNSFALNYAYRLVFDERNYLALGLGLGADNVSWNYASAQTTQEQDPAFAQSYSKFNFNASFGIYYRTKKAYIGASIPQLMQNSLVGTEKGFRPPLWHYMAIAGYYFEVSDRFIFHPSIQAKLVKNSPFQLDVVLRGITNNLGFSVGYRSENSLIAGFDYIFAERIRVGYSFNYDVGPLARVKGMSNEIYLGIGLPYYFNKDTFNSRQYIGRKNKFSRDYTRKYRRGLPK